MDDRPTMFDILGNKLEQHAKVVDIVLFRIYTVGFRQYDEHLLHELFGRELSLKLLYPNGDYMNTRKEATIALSNMYPGIINARHHNKLETPLEFACMLGECEYAHLLLDIGADITARACRLMLLYWSATSETTMLMKRFIRHGASPQSEQHGQVLANYRKQFESARDASLALIGIRKHKRSHLIPNGVHIDIIKAIAHQIRQRHEEIVIEVSQKKIKV